MKNRNIRLIIGTILLGLLIIAGTFSLYIWDANDNKDVVFNTSKKLQEYIIYDSGESKFVGDFQVGSSYTSGVHTTVSIYKSSEVNNIPLYATINMKVKSIGDNLSSEALKWTVTKGNATSNGEVLASGDFSSLTIDSELALLTNFEVTTTMSEYTIWIWLDETLASPSMSDETLDVSVWTQVDQIKANTFEVTTLTNNYQTIKATIVNSNKKIVSYQISDSNTVPTVWIDIPTSEQNNIYNVEYTVNNTGVYYLWIKDETGKTISKRVEINSIDNTPPVCTWSGNTNINTNSTGTIILTCADNEIGVDKSTGTINISNITLSNSNITISNINREEINNGYKYTLTIETGSTLGSTTMTVPSNIIKNTMNLGNKESSNTISVVSTYTISYKDVGNTDFSGTHEEEYATNYLNGDIVTLDIPTRDGYAFSGYYLSSNGSGYAITKLENQTGNLTLYADWKDNPPYGTASLSLTNGKFTLKLSDQGDDGSGLTGTYGFALTTDSNCSVATYTDQTGVLKEYSENYTNGTTYYGCIKLTDKSGIITYIRSAGVKYNQINVNQLYTTAGEQTYTIPETGTYKLEVWGAQGGGTSSIIGGYGAYASGEVLLNENDVLYIYVGENYNGHKSSLSYNGGGSGSYGTSGDSANYNGGGASDIRYFGNYVPTKDDLLWNSTIGLNSRIIVAGGGGGYASWTSGSKGGNAGGLSGYSGNKVGSVTASAGGTQVSGGNGANNQSSSPLAGGFGIGGYNNTYSTDYIYTAGGGGGYYGGGGGGAISGSVGAAAGGSSYISGHTGCVAIASSTSRSPRTGTNGASCTTGSSDNLCSIHYSKVSFTNTVMIDGSGYSWTNKIGALQQMPNPNGGYYGNGVGQSGNGAARITATFIANAASLVLTYNNNGGSGCYSKSMVNGGTYGDLCTPYREGYTFLGWYTTNGGSTRVTSSTKVEVTSNQTIYAKWEASTKPVILFSLDGNSDYVKGNITSTINVSKGSNNLDASTFKYTWSTDKNATPDKPFMTGNSYTLENATGKYYLIAEACDINNNCVRAVSEVFYVDNSVPTGELELVSGANNINVISKVTDPDSGIVEYGYLITKDSTCPTNGYTTTENAEYNFTLTESNTYLICVKITDKAGNVNVISKSIKFGLPGMGEYLINNKLNQDGLLNTTTGDLMGDMYRYQASSDSETSTVANNYICFGSDSCTIGGNTSDDLYRVIGVTTDGYVKIIKANTWTTSSWHNNNVQVAWKAATLFGKLNGKGTEFTNFYGNLDTTYQDMIQEVDWKYGITTKTSTFVGDTMYELESAFTSTVKAKVGLMYVYDYLYAYPGGNPGTAANNKKSWISISLAEWQLSNYSTTQARYVTANGDLTYENQSKSSYNVRPVMYLKLDVKYLSGDGTETNPYIVKYEGTDTTSNMYATCKNSSLGTCLINNKDKLVTSGLVNTLDNDMSSEKIYRYQGVQVDVNTPYVDNYICFGTKECSIGDENSYRIIGVTESGMLKIIKQSNWQKSAWNTYNSNITWNASTLFTKLNSIGTAAATDSYYGSLSTKYQNMIQEVDWKYGVTTISSKYLATNFYTAESAFTTSFPAKVGLMYLNDYFYAYPDGNALNATNIPYTWINNNKNSATTGVEWVITKNNATTARMINNAGDTGNNNLNTSYIVRPVMYLKSSVKYISGTGRINDPFIIDSGEDYVSPFDSCKDSSLGMCLINNKDTQESKGLVTTTNVDVNGENIYRYQGAQFSRTSSVVNNYICFGSNSCTIEDNNMYRILGVTESGLLKIIKQDNWQKYAWNSVGAAIGFNSSTLFGRLNGYGPEADAYYGNLGNEYQNMISDTSWKYGTITVGTTTYNGDTFFAKEVALTTSVDAKVGLMYLSDYYYTYPKGVAPDVNSALTAWAHVKWNSATNANEWLIPYNSTSNGTYYARSMNTTGASGTISMTSSIYVRPVIYLKNTVKYVSGDGSISNPFIIKSGESYTNVYDSCKNSSLGMCLINNKDTIHTYTGLSNTATGDITGENIYRYQGAQKSNLYSPVTNYICFDSNSCANGDENMYRILGVTESGLIKVIKQIPWQKMGWHTAATATTWVDSNLYTKLNSDYYDSLTNKDMIQAVDWKYGNVNRSGVYVASTFYNLENAFTNTISAKVGLMYNHDYMYTYPGGNVLNSTVSLKDTWINIQQNTGTAAYEWLLPNFDTTNARMVNSSGDFKGAAFKTSYSVRPVFYIKNSVKYVSGTGKIDDPFIIAS